MILVDSSVWIDYFNGVVCTETDLLDDLLGRQPLLIGDLILTEVLQGFRHDRDFQRARDLLDTLTFQPMVGREVALRSAINYRALRSRGITVRKTVDLIIGTFCLINDHRLLHADRDFDPMESVLGLHVVR